MNTVTVSRRGGVLLAVASGMCPLGTSPLPRRAFAADALAGGSRVVVDERFSITLPSGFVRLSRGGVGGSNTLLSAGDFRGAIRETGAATTLSVQRADASAVAAPQGDEAAALTAAANSLASLRDEQSALGGGCPSAVLPGTVDLRGGILRFEMATPLACIPGSAAQAPNELLRHTAVRAAWSGGGVLLLFAGARQTEWLGGAGEALTAAADSFAPL